MSDNTAKLYEFSDYQSTRVAATSSSGHAQVKPLSEGSYKSVNRETQIDDLYSGDTPSTQRLNRALSLLNNMDGHLEAAQRYLTDREALEADDEVMLAQADLPELFACSEEDSGFSVVVLALHFGLLNKRSVPLSDNELSAVRKCVQTLMQNPFMSFEAGLEVTEVMALAGLAIDPPEAELLGKLILDEAVAQ